MENPTSTPPDSASGAAYKNWRAKMDREMSALAAIGLSGELYAIPLTMRSLPASTRVRADWVLAGHTILEQTSARMTVTVGCSRLTDPSERISAEQMTSGLNAPQLILSVGRVRLAGSWQPVHLLPTLESSGRVSSYSGIWDLGNSQFSVILQRVFMLPELPMWVCFFMRQCGLTAAKNEPLQSVK